MRLYHSTSVRAAEAIMRAGFRAATGAYGLGDGKLTGCFFADRAVSENEGARSSAAVVVDVAAGAMESLADFELVEEGKPYREWCLPAALVNAWPRRVLAREEVEGEFPSGPPVRRPGHGDAV
jgi:hypothetical protein